MNTLGRIATRWWWVIGAAALAIMGIIALLVGDSELARLQVSVVVALLVAGVLLRHPFPRTAGTLVVVGAAIPAVLFWAPWLMVIGAVTLAGAAIEVVRLTTGTSRRVLAALGLSALAGAWIWVGGFGSAGTAATDPWAWGPVVLAIGGIALLVASGARSRTAEAV